MKKILIIFSIIVLVIVLKEDQKYVTIPNEAIRYRIIPNSNSAVDQNAKDIIQKELEKDLKTLMKSKSIEETRTKILNNIDLITNNIKTTTKNINYDLPINVKYGYNYFPEKVYNGVKYEEGTYESLVVEIGKAEGDNFWCVLFPPLCMLEASDETTEVEYKFLVKEIIEKIFK